MGRNNEIPRNVLICRFSALGDVAMSIPVVYSVCRMNPGTRFIYITKPVQQSLFVNPPENLIVLGVDVKNKYKEVLGLRRLLVELKEKYSIDALVDLHEVLRTRIIAFFCLTRGIRLSVIRKGRLNKRALTRSRNKVMLPLLSSRARYREAFYRLGFNMDQDFNGLYGSGKGDPALFSEITPPKQNGEQWIGIAPFAQHKGKIYPPEMMEKVVAEMSSRPSTKVFLFGGGEKEREILGSWASKYPNVTSVADKRHGFPVELSLLSHLDIMVSMDSANMHLASLVHVRVISIWGATHPYCGFKGYQQKESDIIQLSMTCRPCSVFGNKPCLRGDYLCLTGINPQVIINKITSILNQKADGR